MAAVNSFLVVDPHQKKIRRMSTSTCIKYEDLRVDLRNVCPSSDVCPWPFSHQSLLPITLSFLDDNIFFLFFRLLLHLFVVLELASICFVAGFQSLVLSIQNFKDHLTALFLTKELLFRPLNSRN
jgi:hypothetical protein